MTSGEQIIALTVAEYNDLADEQTVVRHVKLHLGAVTGQPRFRQHLLCGERILRDDEPLELPVVLHLVLLSIFDPSPEAVDRMRAAIEADDSSAIEDFLCKPHDPNQVVRNETCLCLAARHGSLSSAKLLFEARALLDKCLSPGGDSPLHAACGGGHAEFTRWLLQSQADIREAEANHRWPLLNWACLRQHVEVARVFLEVGVDTDAEDSHGSCTPLIVSTGLGNVELIQLLLERRADINRVCSGGHAALHVALLHEGVDAARLLLQHRADPHLKYMGHTSLGLVLASKRQNAVLVHLLQGAAEARLGSSPKPKRLMILDGLP